MALSDGRATYEVIFANSKKLENFYEENIRK